MRLELRQTKHHSATAVRSCSTHQLIQAFARFLRLCVRSVLVVVVQTRRVLFGRPAFARSTHHIGSAPFVFGFYMWLWLCCVLTARGRYELLDYDPVAAETAVVFWGTEFRLTVLTDRLVRVEHDPSGIFEDRPTLAFVNRRLSVPAFSVANVSGVLQLTTARVSLSLGADLASLRLTSRDGAFGPWRYGDTTEGNLLGTIRSLDLLRAADLNCTRNADKRVHGEQLHCSWAPISRRGVAALEDAGNWCLKPDYSFWEGPSRDAADLYLFAYALRFRDAMAAFVQVAGAVPLPLRATLGIMHSRWYNYDADQVRQVVDAYSERSLPLDCFIFDMDWHFKFGWGGYTWDPSLFPVPAATLAFLRSRGLAVGANLHDDSGVVRDEARYQAMRAAVGWASNTTTVPFLSCANTTFAWGLEDAVMAPLDFDIPWIDWQQGGTRGGCTDGAHNPTIWLNRLRATDRMRRGEAGRATILSRWGGQGSHRYPLGFSGDVLLVDWSDLAYQPYFSLTASNVLFSWSHDIVGPHGPLAHELNVRWIQWGAFSSLFRTHDRGMAEGVCADFDVCANVEIFDLPRPYYGAARAAVVERARLRPYIYTAYRELFDTGIALLRPMYYDWPEHAEAYLCDSEGAFAQYMFGPSLLVAPVVCSAHLLSKMAATTVWLPPGCWTDVVLGLVRCSPNGTTLTATYDLSEVPRFVRGNTVLATAPAAVRAAAPLVALQLEVFPDGSDGNSGAEIYEDDGTTTGYSDKALFARSAISFEAKVGVLLLELGPPQGAFAVLPKRVVVKIFNVLPPAVLNCTSACSWQFDSVQVAVVITVTQPVDHFAMAYTPIAGPHVSGFSGRMRRAQLAKDVLDHTWSTPGSRLPVPALLSQFAALPQLLDYLAADSSRFPEFLSILQGFNSQWEAAVKEVRNLEFDPVAAPSWPHAYGLIRDL